MQMATLRWNTSVGWRQSISLRIRTGFGRMGIKSRLTYCCNYSWGNSVSELWTQLALCFYVSYPYLCPPVGSPDQPSRSYEFGRSFSPIPSKDARHRPEGHRDRPAVLLWLWFPYPPERTFLCQFRVYTCQHTSILVNTRWHTSMHVNGHNNETGNEKILKEKCEENTDAAQCVKRFEMNNID